MQESRKYRDLLGAFWNKVVIYFYCSAIVHCFPLITKCSLMLSTCQLSLEEVKEVASLNDISLKVIGCFSTIIYTNPHTYV